MRKIFYFFLFFINILNSKIFLGYLKDVYSIEHIYRNFFNFPYKDDITLIIKNNQQEMTNIENNYWIDLTDYLIENQNKKIEEFIVNLKNLKDKYKFIGIVFDLKNLKNIKLNLAEIILQIRKNDYLKELKISLILGLYADTIVEDDFDYFKNIIKQLDSNNHINNIDYLIFDVKPFQYYDIKNYDYVCIKGVYLEYGVSCSEYSEGKVRDIHSNEVNGCRESDRQRCYLRSFQVAFEKIATSFRVDIPEVLDKIIFLFDINAIPDKSFLFGDNGERNDKEKDFKWYESIVRMANSSVFKNFGLKIDKETSKFEYLSAIHRGMYNE